ncbi:hypothetical protein Ancab_018831 [Ancistrocladus abbreviatus]
MPVETLLLKHFGHLTRFVHKTFKWSMDSFVLQFASKDYIHIRARRGQATDSHSLVERATQQIDTKSQW